MLENEVTPLPDSRQTNPAPVVVEPDLEEARRQLAVFGDPNGAYTYQTLCDSTPKVGVPRILHGTLDEVASELAQAQREGHGCYVTVNPTDLVGRASENVTGVRFLVLDEDKEISRPFHKPPTMIVKSKAGRHVYWKLSPPLERDANWTKSRNPFTEAQERLNRFYGTDPAVKDLPRVLRLAGYYHQKGNPFMVRVSEVNPEATYSLDELLEGIPTLPVETLKTVAVAASVMSERQKHYAPFPMACRAELAARWLESDAPPAIQGEQGHSTLLKVCGKLLHGYLLDVDTAFELIKTVYNPRCQPPFTAAGDITHKLEDASKESFYNPDFYLKAPYENWLRQNASSLGSLMMPSGSSSVAGAARATQPLSQILALPNLTPADPSHVPVDTDDPEMLDWPTVLPKLKEATDEEKQKGYRNEWGDDGPEEELYWLWKNHILMGAINVVVGAPERGKSTFTLELAARLTAGLPMPDGVRRKPAVVTLMTNEDSLNAVTIPKIKAYGGNPKLINKIQGVSPEGFDFQVNVSDNLNIIARSIKETGAKLFIIDPISEFLGPKVDSYKDTDIRVALMPLADLGTQTGCTFLLVGHPNKTKGLSAMNKMSGSVGIVQAARSALMLTLDPADMETTSKGVLACVKLNNGIKPKSNRYHIASVGPGGKFGQFVLDEECNYSADGLVEATEGKAAEDRGALEEAKEFLKHYLDSGEAIESKKIYEEGKKQGHTARTITRAKTDLGVQREFRGRDAMWHLPDLGTRKPKPKAGPSLKMFHDQDATKAGAAATANELKARYNLDSLEDGN